MGRYLLHTLYVFSDEWTWLKTKFINSLAGSNFGPIYASRITARWNANPKSISKRLRMRFIVRSCFVLTPVLVLTLSLRAQIPTATGVDKGFTEIESLQGTLN